MEFALIEELDVQAQVRELPLHVRERLGEGPWPEPHCGVCRALEDFIAQRPPGNPAAEIAEALLDYHDTPFRRHYGTKHYREGHEVYARCLEIYTAAGWSGANTDDSSELAA